MSYKPIDSKRDQFRKYVESSGVVEMFSKVLIELFKREKHENPIDFIRENLGATLKEKVEIDFLKEEVNSYRHQVEELKKQLEDLQLQHQKQMANQQQQQQNNDAQKLSTISLSPSPAIVTSDKDDSIASSGNDVKLKEKVITEDSTNITPTAATVDNVPEQPTQNEEDLKTDNSVKIIDDTTTTTATTTTAIIAKTTTPPPPSTVTIEALTPSTQQQPTSAPTPTNPTINTTELVSDETAEKPTAS